MDELAYQKEVASQMATIGGVLAGLAFAVFIGLCSVEKKHRSDRFTIPVFLVSSLSLILATALCGMLIFVIPMLEGETKAAAAVDVVWDVVTLAWGIGFFALFFGVGLAGFRASKKLGIFSFVLSVGCAGIFFYFVYKVGAAFK
jgi:hypothetical protein